MVFHLVTAPRHDYLLVCTLDAMYKAARPSAADFRRQIVSLPTTETQQDLGVDAEDVLGAEGELIESRSLLGLDKR